MTGLVDQLQADAMDPAIPVSTLLRKVKVAAVKLGLNDALIWVEAELSGYKDNLPDYRKGHGQTNGWNPYQGWQPIHFGDPEFADLVSKVELFEPISNYEALLNSDSGPLQISLPPQSVSILNGMLNITVPRIVNVVPKGVIVQIVQRVRDMVLDWALELARAGVTGEGIGFTPDERHKAEGANITIGTFNGSFNSGDAIGANPRINQSSTDDSTNFAADNSVFDEVEQAVRTKVLNPRDRAEILSANADMKIAPDNASLLSAYNRFITSAANHMTVIGPYLPAIGALLGGHAG